MPVRAGRFAIRSARARAARAKARARAPWNLQIETVSGNGFTLEVPGHRPVMIAEVASLVARRLGTHDAVRLCLGHRKLQDWRTLSDYNIQPGASLTAVLQKFPYYIYVDTGIHGWAVLEVYRSDTIEVVKGKIHDRLGMPAHYQLLTFQGRDLEDGKTLFDYDIIQGVLIRVCDWTQ